MNTGKTVIVTGAGSGIGAATAEIFSKNGYDVVLVGRRKDRLESVASTLKTKSLCLPLDILKPESPTVLFEKASSWSSDVVALVNNAGTAYRKSFVKSETPLWEEMFRIHVLAPAMISRLWVETFAKQGFGSIVNVASTAGIRPIPSMSAYGAMKAAMVHMTQTMALELAPHNIRVNSVCPGVVDTEIHALPDETKEKTMAEFAALHPLKKVGQPEDVAQVIYDLAKVESRWVTGVTFPIDGGISLT